MCANRVLAAGRAWHSARNFDLSGELVSFVLAPGSLNIRLNADLADGLSVVPG